MLYPLIVMVASEKRVIVGSDFADEPSGPPLTVGGNLSLMLPLPQPPPTMEKF